MKRTTVICLGAASIVSIAFCVAVGWPTAVKYWYLNQLEDSSEEEAIELAAKRVADRGCKEAIPKLVGLLPRPHDSEVVEALVRLGRDSAVHIIEAVVASTQGKSEMFVRTEKGLFLTSASDVMVGLSGSAVSDLAELARSGNDLASRWAIFTLLEIGDPALPAVLALLKRSEDRIRKCVLNLLECRFGESQELRKSLSLLLEDPDLEIRSSAAIALASCYGDSRRRVLDVLFETIVDSDHPFRRGAACGAIGQLGAAARELVPGLEALSKDPELDYWTRESLLEALEAISR